MRSAERPRGSTLTLRSLLRAATRRLQAARVSYGHGTTNARDEAAWLVLHALGLSFEALEPRLDEAVAPRQAAAANTLIEQRIRSRKPAAYLTHEAWLGPHKFYVDERVIVPRSYIAELLRDEPQRWFAAGRTVRHALDLCTGSACLAILAALTFPGSRVDAADISAEALAVAGRNIADYRLRSRIRLVRSDLFARLAQREYDLIVSNPPYVRDAVMRRLPPEYKREPGIALAGGHDGLELIKPILAQAPLHLTPGGVLVMEVGHNRERVERAFPRLPLFWPETSGGDDCVFVVTRETLLASLPPERSRPARRAAASPPTQAARSPARASTAAAARRRRIARGSAG
jgi:ribosomal protein L3 glutamine methyltransferase